jgi:hypothetical protein
MRPQPEQSQFAQIEDKSTIKKIKSYSFLAFFSYG